MLDRNAIVTQVKLGALGHHLVGSSILLKLTKHVDNMHVGSPMKQLYLVCFNVSNAHSCSFIMNLVLYHIH